MWVYTITLNEKVSAGAVESDWEADNPSTAATGTSVAPPYAVVTSDPRVSDYESWGDKHDYIDSIEEKREIPKQGSNDWNPPYSFANGNVKFFE